MQWIPTDDQMPDTGRAVLAFVQEAHGGPHSRRIRATYAAPKTLEQSADCDGGEYDEAADTYWCEAGWYEQNEFEETHWRVVGTVTHWMPLPDPPVTPNVKWTAPT